MKILICTGIYPPKIGGPSQYAKNIKDVWGKLGHDVVVKTYNIEDMLPTGFRHVWYFFKIIPAVLKSDFIFTLDTYSVGFPSVLASKIFGKKIIIRTGGDFLWESYVERVNKPALLRNFYLNEKENFNLKEKIIFKITKWTLKNTSKLVFSTAWQRDIFIPAYNLDVSKISIVENYYGPKEADIHTTLPTFVASTRDLVWKNLRVLREAFDKVQIVNPSIQLYTENKEFGKFMNEIKNCYAVILVSLGDISPNMILDAIRFNRPFICTREVGIFDRIKDFGIFVDPLNEGEIKQAILKLLSEEGYNEAKEKVKNFSFIHTWDEIGKEFIDIYRNIK